MINLYTIATASSALAETLNLPLRKPYKPIYQARPGMQLPVILNNGGHPEIVSAHWGCIPERSTTSIHVFPMDKVMSQRPMNRWIHTQRCLVPANCFFTRHPESRDVFLIRILNARTFLIGGMYCIQRHAGEESCHFVLLTTESADVLKPVTPDMPVILGTGDVHLWMQSEHLLDLMQLADQAGDQWFDYFTVSSRILTPGNNDRDLLRPTGLSHEEIATRDQKLKAVDLKQDRYDRKGSKR